MDTIHTDTDTEIIDAANRRGEAKKAAHAGVTAARYDRRISRIVISFDTGLDLSFSPHNAQGLEHARPADLDVIEISPSGLGIHFPKIDADLYIPALIDGFLGSRRWLAAQNGKAGGAASTPEKRKAAQENGKSGGRPRKTPAATIKTGEPA